MLSGLSDPQGLAVDTAGYVFVAIFGNNTIDEFEFSQLTRVCDTTTQLVVSRTSAPATALPADR